MAGLTRKKAADAVTMLRNAGITDSKQITEYLMHQGASLTIIGEVLAGMGVTASAPAPEAPRKQPVPVRAVRQEYNGHGGVNITLGAADSGKRGASKFYSFRWLRRLSHVFPSDAWGSVFALESQPIGTEATLGTLPVKAD